MTPLHAVGDFFRELLLRVPLPAARVLFLTLLIAVLVWVAVRGPDPGEDPARARTLKIWAAAALVLQILIYTLM
jgi:hypothetical protein